MRFKKKSRMAAILIVCLAGASLSALAAYRAWTRSEVETLPLTVVVQPTDFTIKISANGELQSSDSMAIAVPPVPTNHLRIGSMVSDGTRVQKGEVLVEFDRTELDLEALENGFDLKMANFKIDKSELAVGGEKSDIVKEKKLAELELEKINEFLPRDQQIFSYKEIV